MKNFIPYNKLSKKEKRKVDLKNRSTWGSVNPVTRSVENKKLYRRHLKKNMEDDDIC